MKAKCWSFGTDFIDILTWRIGKDDSYGVRPVASFTLRRGLKTKNLKKKKKTRYKIQKIKRDHRDESMFLGHDCQRKLQQKMWLSRQRSAEKVVRHFEDENKKMYLVNKENKPRFYCKEEYTVENNQQILEMKDLRLKSTKNVAKCQRWTPKIEGAWRLPEAAL